MKAVKTKSYFDRMPYCFLVIRKGVRYVRIEPVGVATRNYSKKINPSPDRFLLIF